MGLPGVVPWQSLRPVGWGYSCRLAPKIWRQSYAALGGKPRNLVTALPRNYAGAPVGDDIGRDPKGLRHRAIAPKGLNQSISHAALSHIVIAPSIANCHSLFVAGDGDVCDIDSMEPQEKNGGPNFLREWRTYRGLSQAALAERVGTNANMIQYLETGERGLSAKWLRKLAPALETTVGLLLEHDPHQLNADILEMWLGASNGQRRQIGEVVKALLRTGTDG